MTSNELSRQDKIAAIYNETVARGLYDSSSPILEGKKLGHVIVSLADSDQHTLTISPLTAMPHLNDRDSNQRHREMNLGTFQTLSSSMHFYNLAPESLVYSYESPSASFSVGDRGRIPLMANIGVAKLAKVAFEAVERCEWKMDEGSLGLGELEVGFNFPHFPEVAISGHEGRDFLLRREEALTDKLKLLYERQGELGNNGVANEIRLTIRALDRTRRRQKSKLIGNQPSPIRSADYFGDFDPVS